MKPSRLFLLAFLPAVSGCSRCAGPRVSAGSAAKVPFRLVSTFNTTGSGMGGAPVSGRFVLQRPRHLSPGEAAGVLLYFPDDAHAQADWDDAGRLRRLARTGDRFKLYTVVFREPHGLTWAKGQVGENVKFVDDWLESDLFKSYNIDRRRIVFAGVGGGADFAGQVFPVQTRFKYQGAAVVTCGGRPPESLMPVPPGLQVTDAMRTGFRYFFANPPDDPGVPPADVAKTVAYFQGLGFRVESETAEHVGSGPCSVDAPGWLDRFLERLGR